MSIQLWPSSIWAQIESRVHPRDVPVRREPDTLGAHLERTYWETLRDVLPIIRTTPARRSSEHRGPAA
jgi:hypothetical protein